mmetsp:Transcript_35042/g.81041  ORF Transcript_35042/g.81041 Transcript_35042/m.81041 type:complete len:237 (+) Transcript_35042:169-879(+)
MTMHILFTQLRMANKQIKWFFLLMVISYATGNRIRIGTPCENDTTECQDVQEEPSKKCVRIKNEENCPVTCRRVVHHGSRVNALSEDWTPTTEDECKTNQGNTEYKLLVCLPTSSTEDSVGKYADTKTCGSVICGLSLTNYIQDVKLKIEKISSPQSVSGVDTSTPQYKAMDLIIKKQLCTHKDSFVDSYVGYVLAFTWTRFRSSMNINGASENLCQNRLIRCDSLGKIIHINMGK